MSIIYPLPKDIENTPIEGISSIPYIQNFTVTSGTWVDLTTSVDIKNFILQCRTSDTWFFATASGSSTYFSVKLGGAMGARLVTTSGTSLGWASSNTSVIIEMMQGR
jgi:hypothetical protein